MTVEEFAAICTASEPPSTLAGSLLALFWDARGDWDKAHAVAQGISTPDGSLIHAYLHRKEGDQGNARYWYDRAGRPVHRGTLDEEWHSLAAEMCRQA